ncbi:hypothetical protein BN1088_1750002 [Sphingobacterium sp. PM2-P1-29]|nr:hypothetical protein BN1088_1750002 [Sphingobacterium sp. PM2-P1-29]
MPARYPPDVSYIAKTFLNAQRTRIIEKVVLFKQHPIDDHVVREIG